MRILCLLVLTLQPVLALGQTRPDFSPEVRQYIRVDAPRVALTHVRIVDGTGAPMKADQTILIEGSSIVAVGSSDEIQIPDDAEVLELRGHTVIPGLIGLHDHSYYSAPGRSVQLSYSGPRLYLAAGVTTIRTTGSIQPYTEMNLKRAIEAGEIPGPRTIITGPYMTGGQGASDMNRLSGPEDARRTVAYWAEEGVTWFKAYTEISREELGAAIDEAHRHGVKVTAHLCSVSYREAVALGIDNLEHGLFANTDYAAGKEPDVCPPDFRGSLAALDLDSDEVRATFRDMIDNGVGMTSTLAVYEMYVPDRPPIEPRALEILAPEVAQAVLEARRRVDEEGGSVGAVFEKAMQYERAFVEAGFEPVEAITILTDNGAKILDMDDRLGTVTVGKLADLVVSDGDPIADPARIREVRLVFKEGVGYDPGKLLESIRGVGVR